MKKSFSLSFVPWFTFYKVCCAPCNDFLISSLEFKSSPGSSLASLLPEKSQTRLYLVSGLAKGGDQLCTDARWLQLKEQLHSLPLLLHSKQQDELCRLPRDFPFQRLFAKDFYILQHLLRKCVLSPRQCQVLWLSAQHGQSFQEQDERN